MADDLRKNTRLRCRALILDHDDTVVTGTEDVHYPALVEAMRIIRPELEPCSLQEWLEKNHHPGCDAVPELHLHDSRTDETAVRNMAQLHGQETVLL